jgi:hypothetical protein
MSQTPNGQLLERSSSSISQAESAHQRDQPQIAMTGFVVLFCIVGLALWGLPFYYDFMTKQFGWSRAQVTSGNALSKLAIGPVFGFFAGWIVAASRRPARARA